MDIIPRAYTVQRRANLPYCARLALNPISTLRRVGNQLQKTSSMYPSIYHCSTWSPTICRWLYALFLAIDANFRMRRKIVSSDVADPGLNKGWAYIVNEVPYKAYLKDYKGKPEVSL